MTDRCTVPTGILTALTCFFAATHRSDLSPSEIGILISIIALLAQTVFFAVTAQRALTTALEDVRRALGGPVRPDATWHTMLEEISVGEEHLRRLRKGTDALSHKMAQALTAATQASVLCLVQIAVSS